MTKSFRIVTRKSALALWQAEYVREKLMQLHKTLKVDIIGITTKGDEVLDIALDKIGGKGLFVKELEKALLAHEADIAVHSLKDMPAQLPKHLMLGAVLRRASPYDVLVSPTACSLSTLKKGAIVGTSSLRRQSQLLHLRSDLDVRFLRGNVDTRMQKLEAGEFDAVILAQAGLERLGLMQNHYCVLSSTEMIPAVGQGALGIECREEDEVVLSFIEPLNDYLTQQCVLAERVLNKTLGGSCHAPIGALAIPVNGSVLLKATVGTPDGKKSLHASARTLPEQARNLGETVANKLIEKGAKALLQTLHHAKKG